MPSSRLLSLSLLLFCIVILVVVYFPGLSGSFEFDDNQNIITPQIENLANSDIADLWQYILSSHSGPLGRPVAMASFGTQIALFGPDPHPMKLLNLAIHAMTGLVLFLLACCLNRRLSDKPESGFSWPSAIVAAIVAMLWLLHPMNLTNVTYIVQRMNSLAALFTALAILIYARERTRQQQQPGHWPRTLILLAVFGIFGVFSKETALLLPIYLFIIEFFLFRFQALNRRDVSITKIFFATILWIPSILAILLLVAQPHLLLAGYEIRPFNLEQRLLTETRVLLWYLSMIVVPDISQMTLYHDGITLSTDLWTPPSTLLSILVIVSLLVSALALRKQAPWFGFGIAWFFGGHLLESTAFPLEMVFEHRNYLPAFGPLFTLTFSAALFIHRLEISPKLTSAATMMIVVMLATATHTLAHRWSGSPEAPLLDALHHPESPRANIIAGNTYSILAKRAYDPQQQARFIQQGDRHFQIAHTLIPDSANALFGWLFLYYENSLTPPLALLPELHIRLQKGLIDTTTINGLHSLTDCKIKQFCSLSDKQYLYLMETALKNPRLLPSFASNVLRDLATFQAMRKQDYETAITLTKKAIELTPDDLNARHELVVYLANGGHLVDAQHALRSLEQHDKLHRFDSVIQTLRQQILPFVPTNPAPINP